MSHRIWHPNCLTCDELLMSAFLNSFMKAVIALTRQDEILREFAFLMKQQYVVKLPFANRQSGKKL